MNPHRRRFSKLDKDEVNVLISSRGFRYGSPGTPGAMTRTPAGLPKGNQNASPTPAASQAWAMRQQAQSESYPYSQLSPSRSPSGPTYTQLSSGINSRPSYATSHQQQTPQPGNLKQEIMELQ